MPWYPLGQPVTVSTAVTVAGVATDAGAITLKLYRLTTTAWTLVQTYTPTRDGVGLYHQALPAADLSAAGRYRYDWTTTGVGAGERSDVLDVFNPATYPRLVSFTDAKDFLKLTGTAGDALLERMVGWASARLLIEVVAYASSYTDRVRARQGRFVLSRTPVREVTAVTGVNVGAVVVDPTDLLVLNPAHGLVAPDVGVEPHGLYDVTYTAGPDEVPPGVDGACLQLIQHWWNQSQAHGSGTYGDGGFVPDVAGLPFAVTNKLAVAAPPVLMA